MHNRIRRHSATSVCYSLGVYVQLLGVCTTHEIYNEFYFLFKAEAPLQTRRCCLLCLFVGSVRLCQYGSLFASSFFLSIFLHCSRLLYSYALSSLAFCRNLSVLCPCFGLYVHLKLSCVCVCLFVLCACGSFFLSRLSCYLYI